MIHIFLNFCLLEGVGIVACVNEALFVTIEFNYIIYVLFASGDFTLTALPTT